MLAYILSPEKTIYYFQSQRPFLCRAICWAVDLKIQRSPWALSWVHVLTQRRGGKKTREMELWERYTVILSRGVGQDHQTNEGGTMTLSWACRGEHRWPHDFPLELQSEAQALWTVLWACRVKHWLARPWLWSHDSMLALDLRSCHVTLCHFIAMSVWEFVTKAIGNPWSCEIPLKTIPRCLLFRLPWTQDMLVSCPQPHFFGVNLFTSCFMPWEISGPMRKTQQWNTSKENAYNPHKCVCVCVCVFGCVCMCVYTSMAYTQKFYLLKLGKKNL